MTDVTAVPKRCQRRTHPTTLRDFDREMTTLVPTVPATKLLYRVEEAGELLSLSRSRMFELIRSGAIRSVTQGRTRLIPHSALEAFVADLERAGR